MDVENEALHPHKLLLTQTMTPKTDSKDDMPSYLCFKSPDNLKIHIWTLRCWPLLVYKCNSETSPKVRRKHERYS